MLYLVAIAWLYVALMMAVAEAFSSQGTVLGAIFTFILYGLGPVALVLYLLGTPARRKARRRAEQAQAAASPLVPGAGDPPDGSRHAPRDPVAPERKEP
ncbi:hypothetical protein [Caldimonas thermodepolymerans]|uniref:Transmembrane protein n=2 Tax=Caldimonas thermodepolymerans TaxID=215580 RepID=A0AA46DHS5_9BURK|nr:hypothetical protein EV676_101499 [Caldimonas thermodepolymerans]